MASPRKVSVSRVIPASRQVIFDLLANPRRHSEMDGSGTLQQVRDAPERLSLGATFSMSMKDKVGYFTRNKVVVFEEGRAIAWHHFAQFVWRYDLEDVDGGTKVTESFDYSKPWGFVIVPLGWPERNEKAMAATLERIEQIVTAA
jgi:uncharacterized protein YndB with AHSA1/START domain